MANKTEKILEALADYATECYAEGIASAIKNKWISCSAMKPEPETLVLVTIKVNASFRTTEIAFYEDGKLSTATSKYRFDDITIDTNDWEYLEKGAYLIPESWWVELGSGDIERIDDDFEVIAWQPLPEPYKE